MATGQPEWSVFFEGNDGTECEEFIAKVHQIAYHQGKQKDDQWIAEFVAPCLKGRALRWYTDLDEEVQDSWKLLRRALLAQYPRYNPDDVLVPTPAAAPPVALATQSALPRRGRIQFKSGSGTRYIGSTYHRYFKAITSVDDALQVDLIPAKENSFQVKLLNSSNKSFRWLGIHWSTFEPKFHPESPSYAWLCGLDGSGGSSWGTSGLETTKDGWKLAPDGELLVTGKSASGVPYRLQCCTLPQDHEIFLAVDSSQHPTDIHGTFYFEGV